MDKPLIVAVVDGAVTSTVVVAGKELTRYDVIGVPPVFAGACHATVATTDCVPDSVTVTFIGGPGGPIGVRSTE
jgi:hypothetical protein